MMNTDSQNEGQDPLAGWAPSIRACALSHSYEEYLELMAQFTAELQHELHPDYKV